MTTKPEPWQVVQAVAEGSDLWHWTGTQETAKLRREGKPFQAVCGAIVSKVNVHADQCQKCVRGLYP